MVLQYGYDQTKFWFGQATADLDQGNAIKVMWGGTSESDPNHPARWNEVHSPDYIAVLPNQDQIETVRCIAVVAKNGQISGDTEGITVEIQVPPGRPTRWHAVGYGKALGPSTILSTVKAEQVTALPAAFAFIWFQVQSGAANPGSAISIVSRAPSCFDAFVVAPSGTVCTAATQGSAWGGWWTIPGVTAVPGGPISAVSRSLNKLDIFLADNQGRVVSAAWDPSLTKWAGWSQIQGGVTSAGAAIAAVSRRPGFLDIFVVGTGGAVYTAAWAPGAGWRGWWIIPGILCIPGTPLVALSPVQDVLLVMTSAVSGNLVSASWTPTSGGWSPWSQIS